MGLATVDLETYDAVTLEDTESGQTAGYKLSPCLANEAERTKFEQFKIDSGYLSEPLATELRNDNDSFTDDAVQLLKFHGSYQQDNRDNRKKGEGKDWQMMLRLRSPAGRIPASLFIALDELSDQLGNGTLRATTRQAFQIHGVRKEKLREVIGTIVRSMGSTLAACGDITRNVMAPAAPYEKGAYPAAKKLANQIADLLIPLEAEKTYLDLWVDGDLQYRIQASRQVKKVQKRQHEGGIFSGDTNEPLYGTTYLPRKFKCAVTVPGDNSVDILTHDIGLVAFTKSNGQLKGCNIYVGGGMGRTHNNEQTFARIADPLGYVDAENVLDLVQSILALQRDYGDRKIRRHSRMKYLLKDKGISWFTNELKNKYFSGQIKNLRPEPKMRLEDYLGWHRQSKGIWFVGLPLLSGRLQGDFKKEIRKIVEKYQLEIRLTPNQDLLLCNIGSQQKSSIKKALFNIGINDLLNPKVLARHAIACPALPLCGLAITEAERALPQVINRIETQLNYLKIKRGILIRMTGCPNGCARPYMAELALVGDGVNSYQLWLGGTPNLQRLAKPYLQRMQINHLEQTLEPLFISWKKDNERIPFGEHIRNLGDQDVFRLISQNS